MRVESIAFDLSNADISSSNTAHCETTIDSTAFLRQTSTLYPLRTDAVVRHVVERLTHLLTDSSTPVHIAQTAALLSVLTEENIDEQKRLLTCLLQEYYPSQNRVTVSTQVRERESDLPTRVNRPDCTLDFNDNVRCITDNYRQWRMKRTEPNLWF